MEFNLYEQTLTFKELESVLKHDLVKLKERFLDDILESEEEGRKTLYDLKEMAAAVRTHEEVLILIYDYVNSREELRVKRKEDKNK